MLSKLANVYYWCWLIAGNNYMLVEHLVSTKFFMEQDNLPIFNKEHLCQFIETCIHLFTLSQSELIS